MYICGKNFDLSLVMNYAKTLSVNGNSKVIFKEKALENGIREINYPKSDELNVVIEMNFSLLNLILLKHKIFMFFKKLTFESIYIFTESKVQFENFYYLFLDLNRNIYLVNYYENDKEIIANLEKFLLKNYDGFAKRITSFPFGSLIVNKIENETII